MWLSWFVFGVLGAKDLAVKRGVCGMNRNNEQEKHCTMLYSPWVMGDQ